MLGKQEAMELWKKYYLHTANSLKCLGNNDRNYLAFRRLKLNNHVKYSPSRTYLKPSSHLRVRAAVKYKYIDSMPLVSEVYSNANHYAVKLVNNFEYLCAWHGIAVDAACKNMRKQGINISARALSDYKRISTIFNPVYQFALAIYFGEPYARMVSQDYSSQKLKPYRSIPPQTLYKDLINSPYHVRERYRLKEFLPKA